MVNRVIAAKILKMKRRKRELPRHLSAEAVSTSKYDANHPLAIGKRKFRSPSHIDGEGNFIVSNKKLRYAASIAGMSLNEARKVVDDMNAEREYNRGLVNDEDFKDTGVRQFNSIAMAKEALKAQPTVRVPNMDKAKGSTASWNQKFGKPDKTFARPEFYEPEVPVAAFEQGIGITVVRNEPVRELLLVSNWSNWKQLVKTNFVRMNAVERTGYSLDLWVYGEKVYYIELDFNNKIGRRSRNYFSVNRARKELDYIRWVEEFPVVESS